jgi:hypothetical protein
MIIMTKTVIATLVCAVVSGGALSLAPSAGASPRCDFNPFAGAWVLTDTGAGGQRSFLGYCPGGIRPYGPAQYGITPHWPAVP